MGKRAQRLDAGADQACEPAGSEARSGHALSTRARDDIVIVSLVVIVIVATAVSLLLGKYPIEPTDAVCMLLGQVFPIDQFWTNQQQTLFFNVRLPRILLALMVGCCLAAAGAAFQGTFQNPLVSPDILGASQGAASSWGRARSRRACRRSPSPS